MVSFLFFVWVLSSFVAMMMGFYKYVTPEDAPEMTREQFIAKRNKEIWVPMLWFTGNVGFLILGLFQYLQM